MHPFVFIGAIAGAFWLGRNYNRLKKSAQRSKQLPSVNDLPALPEAPDLPDLPTEGSSAPSSVQIKNAAVWAKLAYDAEIYPATADKTLIAPPPRDGLSASRNCAVVAIGERWWDRAGRVADNLERANMLNIGTLERALFPAHCRGSQGAGIRALRAELAERAGLDGMLRNRRLQ